MAPQNLAAPSGPNAIKNGNTSMLLSECTRIQAQDALQALFAMPANLNSFNTQPNVQSGSEAQSTTTHNQPTYISIPEEDALLFAIGSHDDVQPHDTNH